MAIEPLLLSLRSVPSLTKEQRDQLPLILATIGPSTIPALVRHLHDPHEHVRAIAAAALGHLHALETVPLLVPLARTPATWCGRAWSKRLGLLGAPGAARPQEARPRPGPGVAAGTGDRLVVRVENRPARARPRPGRAGRGDAGVRPGRRLGGGADPGRPGAGPDRAAAAAVAPGLIALLKDADETVRCQAAEALGQVGGKKGPRSPPWSSCCKTPVPRSRRRRRGWGR